MVAECQSEAVSNQFAGCQISGLVLGPALGAHLGQHGLEFACMVHAVLASMVGRFADR